MDHSLRKGVTFGLTSAVITTAGLMAGLYAGTRSRSVVLGGIVTIAIADGFSDALGIHVSEESEAVHTSRQIWISTFATATSKCVFALSFAVPLFLFSLTTAVYVALAWGMGALTVLSYIIARSQGHAPRKTIGEHLLIGVLVIAATHWVGRWVATFGN